MYNRTPQPLANKRYPARRPSSLHFLSLPTVEIPKPTSPDYASLKQSIDRMKEDEKHDQKIQEAAKERLREGFFKALQFEEQAKALFSSLEKTIKNKQEIAFINNTSPHQSLREITEHQLQLIERIADCFEAAYRIIEAISSPLPLSLQFFTIFFCKLRSTSLYTSEEIHNNIARYERKLLQQIAYFRSPTSSIERALKKAINNLFKNENILIARKDENLLSDLELIKNLATLLIDHEEELTPQIHFLKREIIETADELIKKARMHETQFSFQFHFIDPYHMKLTAIQLYEKAIQSLEKIGKQPDLSIYFTCLKLIYEVCQHHQNTENYYRLFNFIERHQLRQKIEDLPLEINRSPYKLCLQYCEQLLDQFTSQNVNAEMHFN